jgi:cobalt-zinc-cadmium resistance protein CzcA
VVIGGVIGAMVMSLLVLRVLYLVFDALARWVGWVLVRVSGVSEAAAASLLGLDTADGDEGVGSAGEVSRGGLVAAPPRRGDVS